MSLGPGAQECAGGGREPRRRARRRELATVRTVVVCRLSKSAAVTVYPSPVFAHWAVTVAGSVAPIGRPGSRFRTAGEGYGRSKRERRSEETCPGDQRRLLSSSRARDSTRKGGKGEHSAGRGDAGGGSCRRGVEEGVTSETDR